MTALRALVSGRKWASVTCRCPTQNSRRSTVATGPPALRWGRRAKAIRALMDVATIAAFVFRGQNRDTSGSYEI